MQSNSLEQQIQNKAYQSIKVPNKLVSKVHPHPLIKRDSDHNGGWSCDGADYFGKCYNGITGFGQSKGIDGWRCEDCDVDFCVQCAQVGILIDQSGKEFKSKSQFYPCKNKEDMYSKCYGKKCVMVFGDGDQMKEINSKQGPDVTDKVLLAVHNFFQGCWTLKPIYYCREHITEGDEWVFMFLGNINKAMLTFDQLNKSLRNISFQGVNFTLSFSLESFEATNEKTCNDMRINLSKANKNQKKFHGKGMVMRTNQIKTSGYTDEEEKKMKKDKEDQELRQKLIRRWDNTVFFTEHPHIVDEYPNVDKATDQGSNFATKAQAVWRVYVKFNHGDWEIKLDRHWTGKAGLLWNDSYNVNMGNDVENLVRRKLEYGYLN